MKIESLRATNFAGFKSLQLKFAPGLNVLAGVNGSGKSTVLRIISTLLVRHIVKPKPIPAVYRFAASDVHVGMHNYSLSINANFEDYHLTGHFLWEAQLQSWLKDKMMDGRDLFEAIYDRIANFPEANIPLIVKYPVDRAVRNVPLRIRTKHTFDRASTFKDVSTTSSASFPIFFEWFRAREDYENEVRRDNRNYNDLLLASVREAIEAFLPGFGNLRVRRQPRLRMEVAKKGVTLNVIQLSDGEKCLLAMVGDMARRLALLNPHLSEPLKGPGIVMIDEIELHLHPAWQRLAVEKLPVIFPNCQFILTTHSPNVLNHVPPERITILWPENGDISVREPSSAYGRDSASLFSELFDIPARPDKVVEEFSRLFYFIHAGKTTQARSLLQNLRNEIGEDPELVKADYLLRFKEHTTE